MLQTDEQVKLYKILEKSFEGTRFQDPDLISSHVIDVLEREGYFPVLEGYRRDRDDLVRFKTVVNHIHSITQGFRNNLN